MPDSEKSRIPFLSPQTASYFIAGGVAGAASRTVVSPLERLKIILQVQPTGPNSSYKGVWPSLAKMWREEGWRGMMAGNGINCLRIVPYSAVQFTTYERLKKLFTSNGTLPLDTPTRLLAGALAGITSVTTTYPLDLVRSRLSIASASIRIPNQPSAPAAAVPIPAAAGGSNPAVAGVTMSASARGRNMSTLLQRQSPIPGYPAPPREPVPTMWGMTLKVMREEGGIRGLYRGLIPTAMGVAPYVGINFAAYERLRQIITPEGGDYGAPRKLMCGALAGTISQTLTYPFDVLRRKMQVVGMSNGMLGYKYNGAIDALRTIARVEGMAGLYRGIWPNLLKVAPSIATSFFVYETVKEFLYPARPSSSS